MSTGVTRWLYWLEAIERATPADFPRLARLAKGNPTATRMLAERWAQLAPRHMFDALVAEWKNRGGWASRELADVLLQEWLKRDPNAVIAALNETNGFALRGAWRHEVAARVIEHDAELGLRLYCEWDLENAEARMSALAAWAAADPRHAAQFTLDHPAGHVSRVVMEAIGKAWAGTEPAQAQAFAASQPNRLGNVLASAVLKTWAGQNLGQAQDWFAQAAPQAQSQLCGALAQAWARTDADGALAWCEDNLTGSALTRGVVGVVGGAAEKDFVAAAGLVSAMDPSTARAEAAVALAQKWVDSLPANSAVTPEDALVWLSSLDADSVRRVLGRFAWQWAHWDYQSMASFLASASSDQVLASAYSALADQMDPVQALTWCASLPADRALSAGMEALDCWCQSDLGAAMTWLCALPADDPRRQPFLQESIHFLASNPQAADVAAALSPADRAAAQTVIDGLSLAPEQRSRLLQALRPP
jgi:hypothetical protein